MPSVLRLPTLADSPFVTVIIPCLDEEAFIEAVVLGALAQRWPADRLEVLVVDGGSTDATRAIVGRIAAADPRVALLDNPRRIQSAAMNVAIRAARGDVICRMDAHADYADDYLAASVQALRRTGAANVGGAARPRYRSWFQRALCAALSSPLGVGGSAYRDASREGFVDTVFNGCFRREAFEVAGLYDPEARTNEDAELNQRIIEAGGTVWLARDVVVHYYPRASLGTLAKQYFTYGQGRARTLVKRGRFLSLRPMIPFATVTGFAGLAMLAGPVPLARPALAAAAIVYGAAVALEAARVAWKSRRDASVTPAPGAPEIPGGLGLAPAVVAIFPAMHLAHGLGFWAGLLRWVGRGGALPELERLDARPQPATAAAEAR